MTRMGRGAVASGLGLLCLVAGIAATVDGVDGAVRRKALKSTIMTDVRHEALNLFPRGSRLADVAGRLVDIGFSCEPMKRSFGDISGPALLCASNGRGYPDYPAINVTVSSRNGLVSEIEVWNLMARSDDDALLGAAADAQPRT